LPSVSADSVGFVDKAKQAPASRAPSHGRGWAGCAIHQHCSLGTDQDRCRRVTADVAELTRDQRDIMARDLPVRCIAANLLDGFVDVVHTVRVALGKQAAMGINRQIACGAVERAVAQHVGHHARL
jgi:hypothetical protein